MSGSNDLIYIRGAQPYFRLFINGTYPIQNWEKGWLPRLMDTDSISYGLEDWTGRLKVSAVSFMVADTDRAIWNAFYGSSGTFPLNSTVQFQVALGTANDKSDYFNIFTGRITNFKTSKAQITITAENAMRSLANAYFIWDYHNITLTEGGGSLGKVTAHNGSMVYFSDSLTDTISGYFTDIVWQDNSIPRAWDIPNIRKYWSLHKAGQLQTGILEGDVLKFHGSSVSDANAGSFLFSFPSYTVRFGTVFNRIGTLELNRPPDNIKVGDNIYRRKDLFYTGNPADIVWRMLTGTNTTVKFDTATSSSNTDIDYNTWNNSKKSLIPMNVYKLIEPKEGEQTKVIEELNELLENSLGYLWFNQNGKLFFKTFGPQDVTQSVGTNYQFDGTTKIIGEDFEYWSDWDDVANVIEIYYDYIPASEVENKFYGYTSKKDSIAAGRFGSQEKSKVIRSKWIHDENIALTIRNRYLARHKYGMPQIRFRTTFAGLDINLATTVQITHPEGSLTNRKVFLTEKFINPLELECTLIGWDFSSVFGSKGYGFWMGGGSVGNAVSGTSKWGWGSNGTTHNINTLLGETFRWW